MQIELNTKIGDIVRANFRTAQIFESKKIDFCCRGGISIQEACAKSQTKPETLIEEIEDVLNQSDPDSVYFESLELDALCDYIEKRHHRYVEETAPFLQTKLDKLCHVHGVSHPELFEIKEHFDATAANLAMHMKKEELMLFPSIRKLVKFKNGELPKEQILFGHIAQMIQVMNDEHQAEGERLQLISVLSSGYTCPPDGCSTYRVGYQTLHEFEQDLHKHIHLENNVLFEKALVLEANLMALPE